MDLFYKRSLICGLILSFLSFCFFCVAEPLDTKRKIIAVGDRAYPPLEYLNDKGIPSGFNVDIFRAVMKRMNLDYEIRLMDWDKAIMEVREGRADMFIDLGYSKDRAKVFDFASPHNYLGSMIVCRKNSPFRDASALRGRKIILQRNEITAVHVVGLSLTKHYVYVNDALAAFTLLLQNKYDAFVCNRMIALFYINRMGDDHLEAYPLELLPPVVTAMAVLKKENTGMFLSRLGSAEQRIREDGTYMRIYRKWFVGADRGISRETVAAGILILLLLFILVFVLYFYRSYKKHERDRKLILNGVNIPLALMDDKCFFHSVNNAFEKKFGVPHLKKRMLCKDYIPCPLECRTPLEDACIAKAMFESRKTESRIFSSQGHIYRLLATPVFGPDGKIIYAAESFVDITEQVNRIENEKTVNFCLDTFFREPDVDTAIARVLESICRYMNATRVFVMKFDSENRTADSYLEYVNGGGKVLFNCSRRKFDSGEGWFGKLMKNEPIAYSRMDYSPEVKKFLGIWASLFENSSVKSLYVAGVFANSRLCGDIGVIYEDRHYSFSELELTFLRNASQLLGQLLERRYAHEALVRALNLAQAGEKAKSFFIASISHEIRTPLNSVLGFVELLKAGDVSPADRKMYLDSISFSGNALLRLINDVLDLSKLESGQMPVLRECTCFCSLASDVIRMFLPQAEKKSVELRQEFRKMPKLMLDGLRLRQVLVNLVGNAVKFTSYGFVELKASWTPDGDCSCGELAFVVTDTGIGIDVEDRKKLMEPFVQLSKLRGTNAQNNGTGLGLSISKRLIENMGGTISLESEIGKGTSFRIVLPHVPVCEQEGVCLNERKSEQDPLPLQVLSSPDVLLVDDVSMNLKVLSAICRKAGCGEVVCASSGAEALRKLEERRFDVVLTDLWMPEMDGSELSRKIRSNPVFGKIPIVAVTADIEVRDNFSMEFFSDILQKPVTLNRIAAIFSKLEK